jgi:hypothetical protein
MVKVEEGEEDGNEKSRKVWKDCNVGALIVVCQGDGVPNLLFVKDLVPKIFLNSKKKKKVGKI